MKNLVFSENEDRLAAQWKSQIDIFLNSTDGLDSRTNQYGSTYPVRDQSYARWLVDGHAFMEHAADMLEAAKEEIYIAEYWFTPELFMKRPASIGSRWQLMNILQRKAEQGVKVYVMIYKEVELAMMVGSGHAKKVLKKLHPNILVFRHPNTLPVPTIWAHHEKMIVIDQKIAFFGGSDLCFGRWDDFRHKLTDVDYMDDRSHVDSSSERVLCESNGVSHHFTVENCQHNGIILKIDETQHAGNGIIDKANKLPINNVKMPTVKNSRRKQKFRMIFQKCKENLCGCKSEEVLKNTECEKQYDDNCHKLWIGKDYANFLEKVISDVEHPYTDNVDRQKIPRTPWHDMSSVVYGPSARDAGRHFIQRWNQIKSEKYSHKDKCPYLVPKTYEIIEIPDVLRNDAIACKTQNQFFISLIGSSEVSNLICQALFERICKAHRLKQKFRVIIFIPLITAFEGELGTKAGMNTQAVLYWTHNSIIKGPNSLFVNLMNESKVGHYEEYVKVYSLRSHADLNGKLVSEVVYIHSKLMIVDDRFTIIGSANINDRSLLGDRDSEVSCYFEDIEFIDSIMDEKPYKSGIFAGSLRRQLLNEHLGLLDDKGNCNTGTNIDLSDLVSDKVISYIESIARKNTDIYDKVFNVYPTDLVKTWDELKKLKSAKSKCMALNDRQQAKELLSEIKGHIVEFSLKFLSSEDLSPPTLSYQNLGQIGVV